MRQLMHNPFCVCSTLIFVKKIAFATPKRLGMIDRS